MAYAERHGDLIRVTTSWNEKELIKLVPGTRWNPVFKEWTLPLSWGSCVSLRGVFGEALSVGDMLNEWAYPVALEWEARKKMRDATEPEERLDDRLYPFQEVGKDFLIRTRETILGDDMGCGKTVQVVAALDKTIELPAIVICPNSVKRTWMQHVSGWVDATPYLIEGTASMQNNTIYEASQDDSAVIVINYESARTLSRLSGYGDISLRKCRECDPDHGESITERRCQVHPKPLNRIPFKTVIVDEAHKIKSPSAQQTRAVWALAHQDSVSFRWALTGTPIANHPGDLWSILHTISPRDFPTKTKFVDRYCLQAWNPFGTLDIVGLNPANREEFFNLLNGRFRRMRKDVVLSQLPPKIRSQRWVELTKRQRQLYDEFATEIIVEGEPNADNLVSHTRRMQLSSATIDINDGNFRMVEPCPKLDVLEEILDEYPDKQIAVCAWHKQLVYLTAARMHKRKETYGVLTGDVSPYERDLALRQFQEGKTRILIFTIATGGTGLTMTAADTLVFLQRAWSMIDNKQAEDRVHRIGSEKHEAIHIIDIIARDTVEEDQIQSLNDKIARLNEITRDREIGQISSEILDRREAEILGGNL